MAYLLLRVLLGVCVAALVGTAIGSVYAVLDYIGFFAGEEEQLNQKPEDENETSVQVRKRVAGDISGLR